MRKRILPLICLVLMGFALLQPFQVNAITPLDPQAEASLTLYYQKDGKAFPDLQISIYRVAQAFPDGAFQLIAPFSSYPVNIHGITQQEQWKHIASTLSAYIAADQIAPTREERTDGDGCVRFEKLETGLYFVRQVVTENTDGTYIFNEFMVYLPTPQPDGTYLYNVDAKPKCISFVPKTKYTVTKLWQDAGDKAVRPKEVTVEIYKDGALQETQVLCASNNWSYTWHVSVEDYGKWSVVERSVAAPYKVTIQQNGSTFSIINTCQTQPDIPQTGDSFTPLPWILALCISGILLLILGIYSRRRK